MGFAGGNSLRHDQNHARRNPAGTVVAYADNAAVMEGRSIARFYPGSGGTLRVPGRAHAYGDEVRNHNHPTRISLFGGGAAFGR